MKSGLSMSFGHSAWQPSRVQLVGPQCAPRTSRRSPASPQQCATRRAASNPSIEGMRCRRRCRNETGGSKRQDKRVGRCRPRTPRPSVSVGAGIAMAAISILPPPEPCGGGIGRRRNMPGPDSAVPAAELSFHSLNDGERGRAREGGIGAAHRAENKIFFMGVRIVSAGLRPNVVNRAAPIRTQQRTRRRLRAIATVFFIPCQERVDEFLPGLTKMQGDTVDVIIREIGTKGAAAVRAAGAIDDLKHLLVQLSGDPINLLVFCVSRNASFPELWLA